MIDIEEYLTQHAASGVAPDDVREAAEDLLIKVNTLLGDPGCPSPGAGLRSGWRPSAFNANVKNASPTSKHMTGHAVDLSDNDELLDNWLTDEILEQYDLYREAPGATQTWCHLQSISPHSGNRTFNP